MNDWAGFDRTFASVSDEYVVWQDAQADDLATAQAHIDHLIAWGRDMAQLAAKKDQTIARKDAIIRVQFDQGLRYQRKIIEQEAEIARLKGEAELTRATETWR